VRSGDGADKELQKGQKQSRSRGAVNQIDCKALGSSAMLEKTKQRKGVCNRAAVAVYYVCKGLP